MKRNISISISLFTIIISLLSASTAYAFELGLGIYTFYDWKVYSWADAENVKMEGELLEGPVINMTWDHTVSLTLSLMAPFTGEPHADFDFKDTISGYRVHVDDAVVEKSDADIALSYAITSAFKVFAGLKYINLYLYEGGEAVYTGVRTSDGLVLVTDSSGSGNNGGDSAFYRNRMLGGALGVNYTWPLYSSLAVVGNASVIYFKSTINSAMVEYNSGMNKFQLESDGGSSGEYNSVGGNCTLSLSYYIDSINTALSLGGRYQVVYNMFSSGDYNGSDKKFDHMWGITFSAMYFIDFSGEE